MACRLRVLCAYTYIYIDFDFAREDTPPQTTTLAGVTCRVPMSSPVEPITFAWQCESKRESKHRRVYIYIRIPVSIRLLFRSVDSSPGSAEPRLLTRGPLRPLGKNIAYDPLGPSIKASAMYIYILAYINMCIYISLRGETIGFDELARESWGTFAGPWGAPAPAETLSEETEASTAGSQVSRLVYEHTMTTISACVIIARTRSSTGNMAGSEHELTMI